MQLIFFFFIGGVRRQQGGYAAGIQVPLINVKSNHQKSKKPTNLEISPRISKGARPFPTARLAPSPMIKKIKNKKRPPPTTLTVSGGPPSR